MWLYTDLLQELKGECLSSVVSPDEILISLSAAPHCGVFSRSQVKHQKLGGKHFPADLVDHEALPRSGFALFSASVYDYEDLINTRT